MEAFELRKAIGGIHLEELYDFYKISSHPSLLFIRIVCNPFCFSDCSMGVTRSVLKGIEERRMVPPPMRSECLESLGARPSGPELSLRVRAGTTMEGVHVLAGTMVEFGTPECELSRTWGTHLSWGCVG